MITTTILGILGAVGYIALKKKIEAITGEIREIKEDNLNFGHAIGYDINRIEENLIDKLDKNNKDLTYKILFPTKKW
ncbi:MAG: hypothetical protein RR891_02550 [Clostridium sp.]